MSLENKNNISVIMLAASLPPLPAGGAEMQALKLGDALGKKNISVCFITPGKNGVKGKTIINGMPAYRLHSWINALFQFLSGVKKSKQKAVARIEYDDKKELTDQIIRKVSWPTVVYYNIFFFHALFFLWKRRKSFDIIHAHTMEWSAIVATRLGKILNKPVLIKESTMNGFQSLSRFPSGDKLQHMIAQNAHFVAMTKIILENLLNAGIVAKKITKIPNGISIVEKQKRIRNDRDPVKVLFVGNLYQQPAKGIDILLNAWTIVHRQFPAAILQIVGDGVTQGYHDFIHRLGINEVVELVGKTNDIGRYYASADIFVLPSRREGMSNALMEAMLYGLPCVATDISGSQDLIKKDVNGILVPSMNVDALASGICYLLGDPVTANAFGKKARETVISEFDINVVADKYISLYRDLLEKDR